MNIQSANADVENRKDLRADCEKCFGLCCVVPAFVASVDFGVTKRAGQACVNLGENFRCGIHADLRKKGFRGCTVYDCFGAGQKVAQVTFEGKDWRQVPESAQRMFAVFPIMRDLHELLWYVSEALRWQTEGELHEQLRVAWEDTERMTMGSADEIVLVDVMAHRGAVNELLLRTSEMVRAKVRGKRKEYRGADLVGAKLKGADLRGANMRGAYLIGADLRGADMRMADVIGADMRDADIRGADLRDCLFLVQAQLDAAQCDASTKVSEGLRVRTR